MLTGQRSRPSATRAAAEMREHLVELFGPEHETCDDANREHLQSRTPVRGRTARVEHSLEREEICWGRTALA